MSVYLNLRNDWLVSDPNSNTKDKKISPRGNNIGFFSLKLSHSHINTTKPNSSLSQFSSSASSSPKQPTMASPTLITPTSTPKSSLPPTTTTNTTTTTTIKPKPSTATSRRELFFSITAVSSALLAIPIIAATPIALAAEDEEYVKETEEVINKVRTTITMDKNDPNVAAAVSELRDTSNSWVAKYRREKALLGRASFRDMYSALNAVSGHYISFGPTAPIPAKRRARILEEVDTAEKALKRGR